MSASRPPHLALDLSWTDALLVGSPTDPVFAAAIVGREAIPRRVRELLNVESGFHDGLALPIVIVLLASASSDHADIEGLTRQVLGAVALGFIAGAAAGGVRQLSWFGREHVPTPLHGAAVLLIAYAGAQVFHVNEYLAAFLSAVTFASVCPKGADDFKYLGEQIGELLKLGAVFVFAVMVHELWPFRWATKMFALYVLAGVRMAARLMALVGTTLSRNERLTAAWFGPRGFASIVYGLMVLRSDLAEQQQVFAIVAMVILTSIVLHSSTDVPAVQFFRRAAH